MNAERFSIIYNDLESKERELIMRKRSEYAPDVDVLANFKQTAAILHIEPEDVCAVFMMKHVQAVVNGARNPETRLEFGDAQREGFAQRISDARNYLMLMAALVDERSK
jgi:hypothetical protein